MKRILNFVPDGSSECSVVSWIHANSDDEKALRPAIIICPGGGYNNVSGREADPVAHPYFTAGYNTFILFYSVGEKASNFAPLCQLANTVAHIRKHFRTLGIDPNKVVVCGFSAGGHLAASLGILHDNPKFLEYYGSNDHIRPDAMILGYPVITSDEYAHEGSIKRVSGATVGSDEYLWFGLDQHVDVQTPPAFIWHNVADGLVPVENSLKLCGAFSKAKIPFELHVFPFCGHGWSVCTAEVDRPNEYAARWVDWSIKWLNLQFYG